MKSEILNVNVGSKLMDLQFVKTKSTGNLKQGDYIIYD